VLSPRSLGTASLGVGLVGVLVDHMPQVHSDDHTLTLGGAAVALIGLLVRILADQNRGFGSLRGHNAKQDQQLQALIAQAIEQDPKGPVARLLRLQGGESSEYEVRR
jgi:hypothetical protein